MQDATVAPTPTTSTSSSTATPSSGRSSPAGAAKVQLRQLDFAQGAAMLTPRAPVQRSAPADVEPPESQQPNLGETDVSGDQAPAAEQGGSNDKLDFEIGGAMGMNEVLAIGGHFKAGSDGVGGEFYGQLSAPGLEAPLFDPPVVWLQLDPTLKLAGTALTDGKSITGDITLEGEVMVSVRGGIPGLASLFAGGSAKAVGTIKATRAPGGGWTFETPPIAIVGKLAIGAELEAGHPDAPTNAPQAWKGTGDGKFEYNPGGEYELGLISLDAAYNVRIAPGKDLERARADIKALCDAVEPSRPAMTAQEMGAGKPRYAPAGARY